MRTCSSCDTASHIGDDADDVVDRVRSAEACGLSACRCWVAITGQYWSLDTGNTGNSGNDGVDGAKGDKGEVGGDGNDGADGADGAKGDKGDAGAGGGTKYLALLQFDAAQAITSITMVDPASNGVYTTSGVTTATSTGPNGEKFAEFTFSNEGYAPSSVVAYAADMKNDKYKITAFNTAGDNLAHEITGVTMNNTSGNLYDSNLFSSFSSATFKLDCSIDNLDYVRDNIPPVFKEAHVYIVFQF